jgi:hypothetical protein
MQEVGIEVIELENNFTQITFKSKQITFNQNILYVKTSDLNENGDVMHSIKTSYMELPDGELVIDRTRESTVVTLENNVRAEHVFLRLYSNYRYEDVYKKDEDAFQKQILKILTNQDQSSLRINYTPFSENNVGMVTIYSINGRLIKTKSVDNSGDNEISIQDLDPGIYILSLQSSGKSINEKFIKL